MRIVSLCPSNTEIIEFLGFTHWLVGVDDFSDWPKEVLKLPRVGPDLSIDMDHVERLKPDLVLASLSVPGMEKNIYELEVRKIPHIVLNPQNFDDIKEDLLATAKAIGQSEAGAAAASHYQATREEIIARGKRRLSCPSLYWEWWPKPVFTPGKINWLTEMSRMVGARNIFEDVEIASVQTDWEDVKKRNPDIICLAWVGVRKTKIQPEVVLKRPGWDEMEAVKANKIFVLEEELYCRPSPRLLEGAEKLLNLLGE